MNDALAVAVDGGQSSDDLLAALVDGGLYVPVDEQGSVVVIGIDDSGPVLPGYAGAAIREAQLPQAAGSVLCDALRLLDIGRATGLETLAVFADEQWVTVPLALVAETLRERGMRSQGDQTVQLTPSAHPVAVGLRGAIAARLLAHPQVQTVWIGHARWEQSGDEHLMIHMATDAGAQQAAQKLLESALNDVVSPDGEAPGLALRVLEPHEADQAAEIDGLGLDTVRADRAAGKVHVTSHESA